MPAGLPAGIGFLGPISAANILRNKGLLELGRSRCVYWCLCVVSKARLRLSKNRSKLTGKLGKTCPRQRGELRQRLRGPFHLGLNFDLCFVLNPSLYREKLAKS